MRKNWILLELQFSGSATTTLWTPASSSTMAVGPSYTLTRLTCDMTSISINMSVWWRISSTPCLKNRQAQRAVQKDVQSYCPEKTRCCSITILMNTVGKTISLVLPFLQRVQRF